MSDTPRTDAEDVIWQIDYNNHRECDWPPITDVVSSDFARQLERELNEARDLLGDMAFELKYLVKQFDPSGKNHDWNDARKLFEKYRTLEKRRMNP